MSAVDTFDAIVVGAGPAGLAATGALAGRGLSVLAIDEQGAPGGQIWRGATRPRAGAPYVGGASAVRRARRAGEALRHAGVEHAPGATVVEARADEPSAPHPIELTWLATRGLARERGLRDARARALVVATGATERPVAFPGATLPGVMGVGAIQGAIKQGGLVPGGPGTVLAGHGPLLELVLAQLARLGARVDAVLELAPPRPAGARRALAGGLVRAALADPELLARGAALLASGPRVRRYRNVRALRAHGEARIERVAFEAASGRHELPCRLLGVHDGVVPNVQLTRLLGLDHVWDEAQQAHRPATDGAGRAGERAVWVAGDGRGVAGAPLATLGGRLAGLDVARALGAGGGSEEPPADAAERRRLARALERRRPARALLERLYPALPVARLATPDTVVCRCEAVTLDRIDGAIAAGAVGVNRVKAFTRCGMGPCQGRHCGNALTRLVADRLGTDATAAGALRVRPPLTPVLIGDYLAGSGGTLS